MAKRPTKKFLCVDTSILIQCCFLEIDGDDLEVLTKLHKLLDNNKITLLLPEIIKLEFYKGFKIKKSLLIGEIDRHKENINKSGALNEKPKKDLEKIINKYAKEKEESADRVKNEIESIFNHRNTIQKGLEITPEVFINAYKYFFSYLKPFNKETRNEREKLDPVQGDCIIIETLKKFLLSNKQYKLYLCTQNTTDFADDYLKIPLNIHKDIKKNFESISLYNNLGEVLKNEFNVTISKKAIKKLGSLIGKHDDAGSSIESNTVSEPQTQ